MDNTPKSKEQRAHDRNEIKAAKIGATEVSKNWSKSKNDFSLPKRLTVHLKNPGGENRNKFHCTKSAMVLQTEIQSKLSSWGIKREQINKLYFNGRPLSL